MTQYLTRAQTAQVKKISALAIALDVASDVSWSSGDFDNRDDAKLDAQKWVSTLSTRKMYKFLNECGFTFETGRARWFYHIEDYQNGERDWPEVIDATR